MDKKSFETFNWHHHIWIFRALQRSGLHSPAATGNEAEALSSLNAAVVLHKKGHKDKARKLFRHAMALCPKHPKILNHFGEFLEASEGQILQVELLQVHDILNVQDSFVYDIMSN